VGRDEEIRIKSKITITSGKKNRRRCTRTCAARGRTDTSCESALDREEWSIAALRAMNIGPFTNGVVRRFRKDAPCFR
jgi:hypothetical protein